jgi:antitoxin HicB
MTKTLEYYMNLPYPILLLPPEQAGDGWYAKIPLLRGCGAVAMSAEEALRELEEAKRLWFEIALEEAMEIPEPERVR